MRNDTNYEILRVSTSATLEEIKNAYVERCKEFHPEHYNNVETIQCMKTLTTINEAYRILSNPQLRQSYDYALASHGKYNNGTTTIKANEMFEDTLYADYNAWDYDIPMEEKFITWIESFAKSYLEKAVPKSFDSNRSYFELTKQLFGQFYSVINKERYALIKKKERKATNGK